MKKAILVSLLIVSVLAIVVTLALFQIQKYTSKFNFVGTIPLSSMNLVLIPTLTVIPNTFPPQNYSQLILQQIGFNVGTLELDNSGFFSQVLVNPQLVICLDFRDSKIKFTDSYQYQQPIPLSIGNQPLIINPSRENTPRITSGVVTQVYYDSNSRPEIKANSKLTKYLFIDTSVYNLYPKNETDLIGTRVSVFEIPVQEQNPISLENNYNGGNYYSCNIMSDNLKPIKTWVISVG